MRNRLVYAAVGIVGVLLIGLAIASATVWRADSVLHASATADHAIVVTDAGVLEMAGDPVTVTATVPTGDHVVLAIGRDTDVSGWIGTADHQRVAGLAGWHTLALAAPTSPPATSGATATATAPTEAATPTDQPSPTTSAAAAPAGTTAAGSVPDATASDMWVATAQGAGSASLTWQARPGRWSLLVVGSTASGAGAPPTLAFAWPRAVTTPYLTPGAIVGGLLVLVALLLFWRDLRRRHDAGWTPVATGAIPVVTAGEGAMTRRQLREMAELARTGQLPTIARPPVPTASVPVTPPHREASAPARPTPWVPAPVSGPEGDAAGTTAAHDEAAARRAAHPTPAMAPAVGHPSGPGAQPTGAGRGSKMASGARPDAEDLAGARRGPDGASTSAGRGPTTPAAAGRGPETAATPAQPPAAEPGAGRAGTHDQPPAAESGDAVGSLAGALPAPAEAAARKGRWRRAAAEPVAEQAPESQAGPPPESTPVPSSPSWAPQVGAAATAPVPVPVPAAASPVGAPAPGGRRARRQAAEAAAAGAEAAWGTAEAVPSSVNRPARPALDRAGAEPAAPGPRTRQAPSSPAPGERGDPSAPQDPAPSPARPAWMPAGPAPAATAAPTTAAPARSAPAPTAHETSTPAPAPAPSSAHGPGAQPAWLSRVAARWEQEDAAADAEEVSPSREAESSRGLRPSSSAPAPSPAPSRGAAPETGTGRTPSSEEPQQPTEASRADAWRRAWGLPPLETEEKDR